MSVELKIKVKHLALEPAIIRKEERKIKKRIEHYKQYHQLSQHVGMWSTYKSHPDLYKLYDKYGSLMSHRRWDVRNESRATHLARAYIKGVPYKVVETKTKESIPGDVLVSLIRMVMKYGNTPYNNDYGRDSENKMVVKVKAEDKAKKDVLDWLEA